MIRRAYFDLIGLPPTFDEVEQFVNDSAPNAFAKVVDRLLDSPRYGERWGRHWLDVARYADSSGLDDDIKLPHTWRYRDYVIEAFNDDVPFDRFIAEQLAGDLLAEPGNDDLTNDRLIATAFLALGPKFLAEKDPQKMEMDIIDEQIDTVGRTFMGLTLGPIISAYLSFFPVVVGMVKGLRSPDQMQLDLMHTYNASKAQVFWRLRLPFSCLRG